MVRIGATSCLLLSPPFPLVPDHVHPVRRRNDDGILSVSHPPRCCCHCHLPSACYPPSSSPFFFSRPWRLPAALPPSSWVLGPGSVWSLIIPPGNCDALRWAAILHDPGQRKRLHHHHHHRPRRAARPATRCDTANAPRAARTAGQPHRRGRPAPGCDGRPRLSRRSTRARSSRGVHSSSSSCIFTHSCTRYYRKHHTRWRRPSSRSPSRWRAFGSWCRRS